MQFVFLLRLMAGLILNVFFQDKKILFLAIDLDTFSVAEQMCWMHRSDDQRCPKNTYNRLQPSFVVNLTPRPQALCLFFCLTYHGGLSSQTKAASRHPNCAALFLRVGSWLLIHPHLIFFCSILLGYVPDRFSVSEAEVKITASVAIISCDRTCKNETNLQKHVTAKNKDRTPMVMEDKFFFLHCRSSTGHGRSTTRNSQKKVKRELNAGVFTSKTDKKQTKQTKTTQTQHTQYRPVKTRKKGETTRAPLSPS